MEGKIIEGLVIAFEPTQTNHCFLGKSFDEFLKQNDFTHIPVLLFHKKEFVAGRCLELVKKKDGIYHKSELLDTPFGRDTKRLIESGVLDSVSASSAYYQDDSYMGYNRTQKIEKAQLLEISIVINPNQPKAVLDGVESKEFENWLQYRDRLGKIFGCDLENEIIYPIITEKYYEAVQAVKDFGFTTDHEIMFFIRQIMEDFRQFTKLLPEDVKGPANDIGQKISELYQISKNKAYKNESLEREKIRNEA